MPLQLNWRTRPPSPSGGWGELEDGEGGLAGDGGGDEGVGDEGGEW